MTTRPTGPPITHHDDTRSNFDAILAELRQGLVELGSLVTENLRRAGEAMREGRFDLIREVRATDEEIDRLYIEMERRTFETIARQQPVATDLRFLVSSVRILYEQERSGDLVVNCVNVLEREEGFPDLANLRALITRTVDTAAQLFGASVDAIRIMDPDAGPKLDRADDELDELVSRLYTEIANEAESIGLESAIALSRVGRYLERIGDHAVNIAENVTYVMTSQFPDTSRVTPSDQV